MTHLVVVGDSLLDIDVDTRADRLVPDSAAPVLDELARRTRAGGAGLAARLAAGDPGCSVTLVTAVPDDPAGMALRAQIEAHVQTVLLPCRGATGVKTRLRRDGQVVARLDQGGAELCVEGDAESVREALACADAVLVSDYGRGVSASPGMAEALAEAAARRPLVWDPHPRGTRPVPHTRIVTPNDAEAARATGSAKAGTVADACRQARGLVTAWGVAEAAVTLGARGAVLASGPQSAAMFPALHQVDGDVCGAGDRFASRVATALGAGALSSEAVAQAVDAATGFVAAGGVAALDRDPGLQPDHRAGSVDELLRDVRARDGVVVATGGCFDLLHPGHVATMDAARALGDCLVVCVNSDESVRRRKGDGRPLQSLADRVRVLSGLRSVDAVVVFDEDTPERVLGTIRPDIWVKGGDYAGTELPESPLVRSWGGEVVTVPYLPGRSTTSLLSRAKS